MKKYSRAKLTQKEVETRINIILKKTLYILNKNFIYNGIRNTYIELYCPIHNYIWKVSLHQFLYNYSKHNLFGCPYCKYKYSKEICQEAALKCKYRSEFASKFKGEYCSARRNGWLNEICAHMNKLGNRYKRCIYSYEFININGKQYVYVGLTDNLYKRDIAHSNKGSVFNFCNIHNINRPHIKQLTDYIDANIASNKEGEILFNYIKEGWIPINKAKTGGLGGYFKDHDFTFEDCKKIGRKYKNRSEWKENDYPTYYIASKFKWINDILKQKEKFGNKNQRYWTFEKIKEIALKYNYKNEFAKNEPSAYQMAYRNKWLDKICEHMEIKWQKTNLTIEIVKKKIEEYDSLTDFILNEKQMYNWLNKNHIKLINISNKTFNKKKGNPKPICQYTKDGIFIRKYNNAREAELYGFNFKNISQVLHGHKKTHKGYIFKFEN